MEKYEFIAANIRKGNFLFDLSWDSDFMSLLTDEEYGKIMRSICRYAKTMALDEYEDRALNIVINSIAVSMQKRTEKYIERCKKNALNGSKGGRAKAKKILAIANIEAEVREESDSDAES